MERPSSGFQAREFGLGFGMKLTQKHREYINDRRSKQKYKSTFAAGLVLHDSDQKPDISEAEDPLLKFFCYCNNHNGYWSRNHMKLQLEDVFDALAVVYPQFNFVFLFFQLSGHTKKKVDRLSISRMEVGWGGKAPYIHATRVPSVGEFSPTLAVGDMQAMSFPAAED